jgi:hypothetical protein
MRVAERDGEKLERPMSRTGLYWADDDDEWFLVTQLSNLSKISLDRPLVESNI